MSAFPGRHGERRGQHRRHARQRLGVLKRSTSCQMFFTAFGLRQPDGDSTTSEPPADSVGQHLRQRAADMKQRHAEQQLAPGLRFQQQVDAPRPGRPGWHGCGAPASACRWCRRCGNRRRCRCRRILRPLTSRSDGCALIRSLNARIPFAGSPAPCTCTIALRSCSLPADLLDLLPDVGAGHRPERNQDLGVRGLAGSPRSGAAPAAD